MKTRFIEMYGLVVGFFPTICILLVGVVKIEAALNFPSPGRLKSINMNLFVRGKNFVSYRFYSQCYCFE